MKKKYKKSSQYDLDTNCCTKVEKVISIAFVNFRATCLTVTLKPFKVMALDVVDALVCWILVVPEDEKKSTYNHTLCASLKRKYVISYQGNFTVRVIQNSTLDSRS